jgi:hypothetical protein
MFLYAKEFELMLIHFGVTHEEITANSAEVKTEGTDEPNTGKTE